MATNDAANEAMHDTVWLNANVYYDAERRYYEGSSTNSQIKANPGHNPPSVQNAAGDTGIDSGSCTLLNRLETVEKENAVMQQAILKLSSDMAMVLSKLSVVEKFIQHQENNKVKDAVSTPQKEESKKSVQNGSSAAADDDLDLFGSDEEDADAAKVREERLQAYANKKAKKPALVAKSSVVLDVKPWDDETDMKAMEVAVREVKSDGLVWGASKLIPLAYGIKKLQIVAIVEDDKVSIDWLQETICDIEDLVQSVDIAAFNKL